MSAPLARLKGDKPVRWTTVLGLLLVPLTVAGVFLWGLWNPTERLDTITAAVVNLDEPVTLNGQMVPLGRVLAAELIAGGSEESASGSEEPGSAKDINFTWVLTDEADAKAGLDSGEYSTVVTIPKNFSAAATSLSGDPADAEQAHIEVAESDRGRLIDTALSGIVTQTATTLLNQQLGEQFVGTVFVGMNELHKGIGDAADGAGELAEGGTQLAEGATQLADGTILLADGTQQLADGAGELSAGAGAFSGGVTELSNGAGALSEGAGSLASGARLFSTGDGTAANPGMAGFATGLGQLSGGLREFATGNGTPENPGLAGLSAGLAEYTGGINGMLDQVTTGTSLIEAELLNVRAKIEDGTIPVADPDQAIKDIDAALAGLETAGSEIIKLQEAGTSLSAGLAEASAGANQLATGLEGASAGANQLAAGAEGLAVGAEQLAGGASGLASGATQLSAGAAGLAEGTAGLATGTSELAAGVPDLADGASKLAEGAGLSATGTKTLAEGLDEAANGIPNYTKAERDKLAKTAITPVRAEGASGELFNSSGVPLFAGIALWAGALAVFMLLAPLWTRAREAARGVGWITFRSALPAAAIGAVQGAIAGIALPIALGYGLTQGLAFFGLALLAGIAFSLLVQGLAAMFGGFGRFVAFALLVIAFAVGIVSTVPAALAAVGDASPVGAALAGFQSVATGAGGAGGAAILLTLWAAVGLALTALAVNRARKQ